MDQTEIGQLTAGSVASLILHWQFFHASMEFRQRDENPEFIMTAYIPALIWLVSAVVCMYIAKRRHVRLTAIRAMLVTLIGPFAIPLALIAKPEKFTQA